MIHRLLAFVAIWPVFGFAGFVNLIVVYESSTYQLMTAEYVMGGMNPLGQLTEIPLGDGTFKVDILQRHLVAPHVGEPMQGVQLMVTLRPVKPGDAAAAQKTTGAHGGHTDVWQAMMESTAANASKIYMRFDHMGDPNNVATIAPAQFAPEALPIPEPGSFWMLTILVGACAAGKRFRRTLPSDPV